jgi:NADH-quinone oxidoreductase subunit N
MNTLIAVAVLGILTMFAGIFNKKQWVLPVFQAGLLISILITACNLHTDAFYYSNMMHVTTASNAFTLLLLLITMAIGTISAYYYRDVKKPLEDEHAVLLFSLAGALVMLSYNHLIMLFLGIEILSVSLYVLAGSKKTSFFSNEAAMKYFLMGSFSTGFFLFGMALVYGASATLYLPQLHEFLTGAGHLTPMMKAGFVLMMVGLGFKVGSVPFHFWVPDVYHGSPTIITAFMATVSKIASFYALYILLSAFAPVAEFWAPLLAIMAAVTIILGNVTAIYQQRVKRMLAYSGIAHTGYMLMMLVVINPTTPSILLYYSAAYAVATIAAFAILIPVRENSGSGSYDAFNGLTSNNKLFSFVIALSMLSLTGIPPLAGFFGKYFVFLDVIDKGYTWLVLVAILGSMVSIYYYFRLLQAAFLKTGTLPAIKTSAVYRIMLGILGILILSFIFFNHLMPLN